MRFEDLSLIEQRDIALERLHDAKIEIANLKNDLVRDADESFVASVCLRYGLTPSIASFLIALYKAGGKPLTNKQINNRLPDIGKERCDIQAITLMKVYACKARKALHASAIITVPHCGYAMSPDCVDIFSMIKQEAGQ
jgi:hypothetical protein